ncbi:MAG: Uma2 family endonuclease [Candidatus Sericytochromatia bacterium]|uniref:Uma2 family endonuclease n=1 Tax=Candidatus Tanganyikabacteria bacterium TaxID=2961651 RepID=A0A937X500_9BACT|nr:Uma2 family endonuclease [Candidatus Tanganyikabacteria bacterium]
MATQPSRKFMTYQEFEDMPRHGMISELLDGEFYVVSPVLRHQRLVRKLLVALDAFLEGHPIAEVIPAPFDIVLSKEQARVIQPDLMILTTETHNRLERNRKYQEARLLGMPYMAIEVLSGDGRHDRGKKLQYYAENRVPELWHVWPDSTLVEVYRTEASGHFSKVTAAGPGAVVTTPLLPGFELEVDALYSSLSISED